MSMAPEPLYIDNSILSTFMSCDMEGWLRYGLHLTTNEERADRLAGQITASVLAKFRTTWDREVSLKLFESRYKDWANHNVSRGDRLEYTNCYDILDQYMRQNTPDRQLRFQVTDPPLVEVPFELPLSDEGDIIYMGRCDLIPLWETGDYVVLDDKTTGKLSSYWAKKWVMDSGQSGYVWAMRQLGYPIQGSVINGIEFAKLPSDPNKKCKGHKVPYSECRPRHVKWDLFGPYPREDGFLEQWRQNVIMFAREFRALIERFGDITDAPSIPMRGQFNGHCAFCAYPEYCRSGRNPALMAANLVYNKWDPRELPMVGDL